MDGPRDKSKRDRVRRRKVYRVKDRPLLAKTIYDPKDELSKKARELLLNKIDDGMDEMVQYSINKHRRWEYANPYDLVSSVDNSHCDVVVVEKRMISIGTTFGEFVNYNYNQEKAESVTTRKKYSDIITSASSKGLGTSTANMLKNKKCFSENENSEEVVWDSPRLEYRIITPHWNENIMGGETHTYETRSWRATYDKKYKKKHKKCMDPLLVKYNYSHDKIAHFD